MKTISFNKPYLTGKEFEYMQEAVKKGKISGDGYFSKRVNGFIKDTFRTEKVLLTTSCSSALDMAALLLDLHPGDEVIMPSFTFVSTANSVVLRGARPVFADIKETTLNIDPEDIRRKITSRTKAIFPVHYAGISCDMEQIMQIAKDHDLKVVEDAAQGVNAKFKDQYLGTIGDIGCYSFHDTKNYSCGEGGAILLNSADEELHRRAEVIWEKGTNRSRFIRGEVDKYTWVDVGSSFLLSDLNAAFLYGQFQYIDLIQKKREEIFWTYYNLLYNLQQENCLQLPTIPENCDSNYHMFYILLNSEEERDFLKNELKKRGITAVFHYVPLHLSPMGARYGYEKGGLPKTEQLSSKILRLPMYVDLKLEEVSYIVDQIYEIINIMVGGKYESTGILESPSTRR